MISVLYEAFRADGWRLVTFAETAGGTQAATIFSHVTHPCRPELHRNRRPSG